MVATFSSDQTFLFASSTHFGYGALPADLQIEQVSVCLRHWKLGRKEKPDCKWRERESFH